MKKCSLCGEKALEGIEICPECLKKAAVDPRQIKRLQRLPEVVRMRGTDRREKQPKRKPMQYLSCSQPRTERKYRTI